MTGESQERPAKGRTAAEKITESLREMSTPRPDAEALQLSLATLAMGLEAQLGDAIQRAQETGELDEFVLALTRFLATHRSDSAKQLLVVEVRRTPQGWMLPSGTKLHAIDEAAAAAAAVENPLA